MGFMLNGVFIEWVNGRMVYVKWFILNGLYWNRIF